MHCPFLVSVGCTLYLSYSVSAIFPFTNIPQQINQLIQFSGHVISKTGRAEYQTNYTTEQFTDLSFKLFCCGEYNIIACCYHIISRKLVEVV